MMPSLMTLLELIQILDEVIIVCRAKDSSLFTRAPDEHITTLRRGKVLQPKPSNENIVFSKLISKWKMIFLVNFA
jgi:hypothetical protein